VCQNGSPEYPGEMWQLRSVPNHVARSLWILEYFVIAALFLAIHH